MADREPPYAIQNKLSTTSPRIHAGLWKKKRVKKQKASSMQPHANFETTKEALNLPPSHEKKQ